MQCGLVSSDKDTNLTMAKAQIALSAGRGNLSQKRIYAASNVRMLTLIAIGPSEKGCAEGNG